MNSYEAFDYPCPNCGKSKVTILLKPDTFFRSICPECKKSNYAYISKNLDIITFREEEICPSCNGSGKCKKCNGTGEIICPECGGAGWFKIEDFLYGCPTCKGFGWSSDEDWFMEMVKKGKAVFGKGQVACPICKGSGVCPDCMGTRFKFVEKEKKEAK